VGLIGDLKKGNLGLFLVVEPQKSLQIRQRISSLPKFFEQKSWYKFVQNQMNDCGRVFNR